MTAPGVVRSGVGFRHVVVIPLNADGYPAATGTTAFEGTQISGARALTIDDPEPRDIVHFGDDRVFQRDVLPPTTPISGEMRVGKISDTVDALLGDDKSFTVGEMKMFGIGSNNKGDENQVAILAYRQAMNSDASSGDYGKRYWEARLFPRAYVIARESGFEDSPEEKAYAVRPLFVKEHLWGEAFADGTEGFEQAQGVRIVSEYKPKVVAFLGNGTEVTFVLPTAYPAQSTGKMLMWNLGVEQTQGYTFRTTDIVFSSAPADRDDIVLIYEYE